jgi:hypothetical protein
VRRVLRGLATERVTAETCGVQLTIRLWRATARVISRLVNIGISVRLPLHATLAACGKRARVNPALRR